MQITLTQEQIESLKQVSEDVPVMVGTLKSPCGVKYFEVADIGHPVFEFKDRYIIYVKSEIELKERIYDKQLRGDRTVVGKFLVAIPYYKETLKPCIDFIK